MDLTAELFRFFAGRQEIVAAYLFGSRAEGVYRENSDLDIGILLNESARDLFKYRMQTIDLLEKLTKMQVDVILLRNAPLLLQFQVFKNGILVFERNTNQRALYQMRVLSKYYDYQKFFDFHSRYLREAIKERGLGFGNTSD